MELSPRPLTLAKEVNMKQQGGDGGGWCWVDGGAGEGTAAAGKDGGSRPAPAFGRHLACVHGSPAGQHNDQPIGGAEAQNS